MVHTAFPEARQEGRFDDAVIEGLGHAVVIPQSLVVMVHESALKLSDLRGER